MQLLLQTCLTQHRRHTHACTHTVHDSIGWDSLQESARVPVCHTLIPLGRMRWLDPGACARCLHFFLTHLFATKADKFSRFAEQRSVCDPRCVQISSGLLARVIHTHEGCIKDIVCFMYIEEAHHAISRYLTLLSVYRNAIKKLNILKHNIKN